MKSLWDRWSDFWCQFAHTGQLWPIHGAYKCRQCLRVRSVAWANQPGAACGNRLQTTRFVSDRKLSAA
jgi:hypothetical protein